MSLNDPQWGKRGNGSGGGGGPPDLDEIWRNVNRRLSELFGRTPAAPTAAAAAAARARGLPVGGAGAAHRCWSSRSGSRAASTSSTKAAAAWCTRFGKYIETTQPGPRWHLPFPIEAVEIVNFSQVRTVEVGYRNTPKNKVHKEALMLTDDENIVDMQFAVQYTLKSAEDYLFNNRKPDDIVACSRRDGDPRDGRQEQDGLRALRGPRADRAADARS